MRAVRLATILAAVAAVALGGPGAHALETDPYYAWGRTIADSTDALNARVEATIDDELGRLAERRDGGAGLACPRVAHRVAERFRLFLYSPLELWANHSPEVARVPATPDEEPAYRAAYLYATTSVLDPVRWIPPTPTIEVHGVRIGTDKLTHFFSEGWMHYRWYRKARREGLDPEVAVERALGRGLLMERTVLGGSSSGVVSIADLEANERGLEFFRDLCEGDAPMLRFEAGRWRLARPFDFRAYVTPEWDESWQPSIFGGRRWRQVREVLAGYCDDLDHPEVRTRRRTYAARDTTTATERFVAARVRDRRLPDPAAFSIETLCAGIATADAEPAGAAAGADAPTRAAEPARSRATARDPSGRIPAHAPNPPQNQPRGRRRDGARVRPGLLPLPRHGDPFPHDRRALDPPPPVGEPT